MTFLPCNLLSLNIYLQVIRRHVILVRIFLLSMSQQLKRPDPTCTEHNKMGLQLPGRYLNTPLFHRHLPNTLPFAKSVIGPGAL